MGRLRLCNDDPLVTTLRDLFDATPVRVPDRRVKTMTVVASDGTRSHFLGSLPPLLEGGADLGLSPARSNIASLSGRRSRSVEVGLGLQILDGFLAPLGVALPEISALFKTAKEVAFKFDDVSRRYVEITQLGHALQDRRLNRGNPATSMFFEQRFDLLVLDAVLTSRSFTVELSGKGEAGVAVDPGILSSLVGSPESRAAVSRVNEREIRFDGAHDLTFAFSCVQFFVEPDGRVASLQPGARAAALPFGTGGVVLQTPNRVALTKEPELFDWDPP
jgi:hypothetical protein